MTQWSHYCKINKMSQITFCKYTQRHRNSVFGHNSWRRVGFFVGVLQPGPVHLMGLGFWRKLLPHTRHKLVLLKDIGPKHSTKLEWLRETCLIIKSMITILGKIGGQVSKSVGARHPEDFIAKQNNKTKP